MAEREESLLDHLRQPDHWTFLAALALVAANVVVGSRLVSAAAATLLVVALAYDAWEFYG
jgi:hypothetical protein